MESYSEWFKRQEKKPHLVKAKVKPPKPAKKPDIPKPEPGKALDSFIKAVDNLEGDWKQLQAVVDKKAKEPKKPKKPDEEKDKDKGKPFGIPKRPVDDEDEKEDQPEKPEKDEEPQDQDDQGHEEKPPLVAKPGMDIRRPRDVRRPVVRIS
jgi:hypothetical protein